MIEVDGDAYDEDDGDNDSDGDGVREGDGGSEDSGVVVLVIDDADDWGRWGGWRWQWWWQCWWRRIETEEMETVKTVVVVDIEAVMEAIIKI